MDTVLIRLTNKKALKLLHDLEDMRLIEVLKENVSTGQKISEKYEGKLSDTIGEKLQSYVAKSRSEWEARNI